MTLDEYHKANQILICAVCGRDEQIEDADAYNSLKDGVWFCDDCEVDE